MIVGVCRIVLALPEVASLKQKRGIVRRVLERTSHKFNVSVAEVESQDVHQRAVVAFAVLSNERAHANAMLDEVARFVPTLTDAAIVEQAIEFSVMHPEHLQEDTKLSWSDFEERA